MPAFAVSTAAHASGVILGVWSSEMPPLARSSLKPALPKVPASMLRDAGLERGREVPQDGRQQRAVGVDLGVGLVADDVDEPDLVRTGGRRGRLDGIQHAER